ncbi:MAG TPA: protein kinase [Myxococcaceae bacterium]|nr:protein kinase [Myxococcaceae bacterium]
MARVDQRQLCARADPTATASITPDASPARRLPPGATVGRYVVLEYVGEGGMGVVYAAHDFALDRRVSLKLVRSGSGKDAELRRARLLGEAQALARVSHPNVVGVHDVGTLGDEVYVALEHVPGLTLGEWLRAAPRSPAAICDVFAQAGRGLLAAHSAGLVHRDVKPDNILLGDDGRVRLADFGLAVPAGDEGDASAGTPGYMPLEQLRGERVDARADQFAFAVALFEALTGERPYGPRGATRAALRERLSSGVAAAVPGLPGSPAGLRRALQRALAPAAGERFPSLAGLLAALGSETPGRARPLPLGLLGLAAVLLAVVAGAALPLEGKMFPPEDLAEVGPGRAPSWVARPPAGGAPSAPQALPARAEATAPTPLASSVPASAPAQPSSISLSITETTRPSAGGAGRTRPSATPRDQAAAPFLGWVESLDGLADALGGLMRTLRAALDLERGVALTGTASVVPGPGDLGHLPVSVFPASSGGGAVQADGSSLRIASLQQQLDLSLAGGDPTQIAEARFALAQALASDPRQHDRAIALAEQAQQDLQGAGNDASTEELRKRLADWIQQQNSHVPAGSGGGRLTQSADTPIL